MATQSLLPAVPTLQFMIDLQESIALKYLHQAAKRLRSIEHLSKNGFRLDFDSITGRFRLASVN